MPRYFFHEHVRGERTEDLRGTILPDDHAARHQAVQQMPANLKKSELDAHDTYLATEVSNGNKILFIVRGKIVVEIR